MEWKALLKQLRSLEDSGLLLKGVSETIQNEAKEQRGGFLSMLLGTLGASLLGNILAGRKINRSGEGVIRAGYGRRSSNSSTSYKNKKGQKIRKKRQDYENKIDF